MSKWKPRRRRNQGRPLPHNAQSRVNEADALIEQRRYEEALHILQPLAAKYADHVQVLASRAMCYFHLGMGGEYLAASLKLHQLLPNQPDGLLALAQAYLMNVHYALARRAYLQYLARWPEKDGAEHARKAIEMLESELEKTLTLINAAGEERYELAELHEESQVLMERGEVTKARAKANELLARLPDFVPALNNLSQMYYIDNLPDNAMATAERVLELDPQNFHALGNLARYLFLQGRPAEAREAAERLRAAQSDRADIWIKKAETFSYFGDDPAALAAFDGAQAAGVLEGLINSPMFYHLAAVAAWRLGQEERARELWRECLSQAPGFELALANLADLRQAVGERNGPWAFSLNYLLRRQALDDLLKVSRKVANQRGAEYTGAMQVYAQRHPEITHLIPYLLERGDPVGRDFAVKLAGIIKTPELLAALREFALGQTGPDRMRLEAAQIATQNDLLPSGGNVRLWMRGEWQEIMMLGFEITYEPECEQFPPKAERLAIRGMEELKYGDPAKSEQLLKQALELKPDYPPLLNNLAAAYGRQGKVEEARRLIAEIHRKFPDYFFGKTNLAMNLARDGKPDEAEELIEPLLQTKRLHVTEFTSLCGAQIEIAMARRNRRAAQDWIEMWESADPDDPTLEIMRSRVALGRNILRRFRR